MCAGFTAFVVAMAWWDQGLEEAILPLLLIQTALLCLLYAAVYSQRSNARRIEIEERELLPHFSLRAGAGMFLATFLASSLFAATVALLPSSSFSRWGFTGWFALTLLVSAAVGASAFLTSSALRFDIRRLDGDRSDFLMPIVFGALLAKSILEDRFEALIKIATMGCLFVTMTLAYFLCKVIYHTLLPELGSSYSAQSLLSRARRSRTIEG
jgi:hypothetical protein